MKARAALLLGILGALGAAEGRAQPGALWRPPIGLTWQWQLTGPIDLSVDAGLYDLDLFDTPAHIVTSLHARGRRAVCYVSVGAWESWRPDAAHFPASAIGRPNGWPGERWLDIRNLAVLAPLIEARFDQCRAKGFDGVEPDNVDGYANETGFPLTYADQIRFNIFLASAAHARGLSIGLKNDLDQVADLLPHFDWALNEECVRYQECERLRPFVAAGKAVFHVEYDGTPASICRATATLGFSSLLKRRDLDAWRVACPAPRPPPIAATPTPRSRRAPRALRGTSRSRPGRRGSRLSAR
jgi:hypothetical protein